MTCHIHMCDSYLLSSAPSADSGRSLLLVSGSRRQRAPLTSVKLLKTMVGMAQWYTAKMLSSGASNPPTLPDMAPKAVAVCLKGGGRKWKTFPHSDQRNIIHKAQHVVAEKYRMY